MSRDEPFISLESARYLAQVVNRIAASFDVAELSAEEVIELYTLLDRLTETLWREHKHTLLPFYQALTQRLGLLDDDDDEPGDGESGGSGPH